MEHLDALYVCDGPTASTLIFRINLGTPGAVEQAGFVHYLHEKFEGRRTAVDRYHIAPHYNFGSVTLEFADERTTRDAKTYCHESLTSSGMARHEVRHDVKHSDLRERKAWNWMREIHAAPMQDAGSPTDHIEGRPS